MLSFTVDSATRQDVDAYAASRGKTAWTGSVATDAVKDAAVRRGTDAIAAAYNHRWNVEFEPDDVPEEVRYAIAEAAIRELTNPGSMQPDRARGGKIKAVGAGSARVEFMDGASAETTFTVIEGLLSGLVTRAGATVDLLRV